MSKKNTQSQKSTQNKNQSLQLDTTETIDSSAIQDEVKNEEKPAKVMSKANFGNMDNEKKFDLSKLKIPKDHYVVRHYSMVELANGQQMEDPTTSRFQVYDKETFQNLSRQSVKNGKQVMSQFENLGLNVDVLHDPTK